MKPRSGFTIIELIAVMVVIMILAGFVIGSARKVRAMALLNRAKTDIAALEAAINQYKADTGHFPPKGFWPCNIFKAHLQDGEMPGGLPLKQPPPNDAVNVTGWKGPYMHFKEEDMIETPPKSFADPWGKMYLYIMPGNDAKNGSQYFDLWSAGPDTESDDFIPSTLADDITNW